MLLISKIFYIVSIGCACIFLFIVMSLLTMYAYSEWVGFPNGVG